VAQVNERLHERLQRLEQRCARERAAREEAERLLETKSFELFKINQHLLELNNDLEVRVASRTAALTKAKRAALELVEIDQLTKLSSRYRFHQILTQRCETTVANNEPFALLLIDIDRFKAINDTYGHGYGDALLVQVAARLTVAARRGDFVARLGGDELAMLLMDSTIEDAGTIAQRIIACFEPPFNIDGVTIRCSASVGIAGFPVHADSPEDLQRAADLALYKAKDDGRGTCAVFSRDLLENLQLRYRREAELKHSIVSSEIEVWYQPIVDLQTGRTKAIEALARMKDQEGEYLPPSVFIPLAEEIGLIRDLGRQVLRQSVIQSKAWIEDGIVEKVNVNVSADEFLAESFVDDVLDALRDANLPGHCLILEITESVMIARLSIVRAVMARLRNRGVSFALDDFGCGYTNLAYLRQLPVSMVKLDLGLLKYVETDRKARAIVRSIVSLCGELGSTAVCEGIESPEQLGFVRSIGCTLGQGYLLGRPLSTEQTQDYFRQGRNPAIVDRSAPTQGSATEAVRSRAAPRLPPPDDFADVAGKQCRRNRARMPGR
jgi:diguanylate cyclase (GGDEF)-like protein